MFKLDMQTLIRQFVDLLIVLHCLLPYKVSGYSHVLKHTPKYVANCVVTEDMYSCGYFNKLFL